MGNSFQKDRTVTRYGADLKSDLFCDKGVILNLSKRRTTLQSSQNSIRLSVAHNPYNFGTAFQLSHRNNGTLLSNL